MLRIRLTRTGKNKQPSYRLVVAEKSKAVKRQYLEMLGHYNPAVRPKKIEINKERVEYWISKGAQPSDSVAALLKNQGFEGMEKYMEPRDKQRRKKGEQPAVGPAEAAKEGPASPAPAVAGPSGVKEAKAEAPAAEAAPAEKPAPEPKKEPPKEEAPAEEAKAA